MTGYDDGVGVNVGMWVCGYVGMRYAVCGMGKVWYGMGGM